MNPVPEALQCVMEGLLELVILVLFGQVGLDDLHTSQDPFEALPKEGWCSWPCSPPSPQASDCFGQG